MATVIARGPRSRLFQLRLLRAPAECIRYISEEQLNAPADAVADLLQRASAGRSRKDSQAGRGILTTRREALALYREVLRHSNLFRWKDVQGNEWRDVIRRSARQEFEAARYEQDPGLVSKLIITGRDAVLRTVEVFLKKRQELGADDKPRGT